MPAPATYLFVYGTLMAASDTPVSRWLRPRVRAARPASVAGLLVAIPTREGWYPALLPSRGARVHGLLCTLALDDEDLARLDRYEGDAYERVTTIARLAATCATAQLYRWCADRPADARAIPGGDFLNWLGHHRLRAYGDNTRRWQGA